MALLFSKSHEWVNMIDDTTATVGLTDYAQNELGGLVFVNLPEEGDDVTAGEPFSDVESVKAVSDVYSPVTGTVAEINEELLDAPEKINEEPYEAWFVKMIHTHEGADQWSIDKEELMDEAAYKEFVASLGEE